ncbi:MAG: glycosyltransferase family 2 protein [Lachnospiraceae bacterium]|nr:glycosyltransferase family 2 protein [Lachnospiraceae bacterium]
MDRATEQSVSIIVPLYCGKQYIPRLIQMIEMCQMSLASSIKLELILSNDNPEEDIEESFSSEMISILVLNTKINRGIQGTRIRGLKAASGEYVVFLDQDDVLYPDYIRSQLLHIANADAVVCRCIHEGRQFYNTDMRFEEAVTKEHMITKGNPIISAGQVLLRRESIPEFWMNHVMKVNGADDYLLWLCMIAQNAVFTLNQDLLFEHTVNGKNLSLDYKRMILSLEEMYDILSENKVFDEFELRKISAMRQNALFEWITLLEKFREMFMVLNRMVECRGEGCPVGRRLKGIGIQRVAIYGAGYLGKRLLGELKEFDIEAVFFIDRNAEYLTEKIPVYKLDDAPVNVDAVIISLVRNHDTVRSALGEKYDVIYTIKEIMENTEPVICGTDISGSRQNYHAKK